MRLAQVITGPQATSNPLAGDQTLKRGGEVVVINTEIVDAWGSDALEEGCLSFPNVAAVIERAAALATALAAASGILASANEIPGATANDIGTAGS